VRAAHRFALANPNIRGDMVELSEFPHLAMRYNVQGVPQVVINETHHMVGAQPDLNLAQAILEALGK
jgi:predicted DsbA family dithiol-disulfide isomerase